jgi:hypothetical protein
MSARYWLFFSLAVAVALAASAGTPGPSAVAPADGVLISAPLQIPDDPVAPLGSPPSALARINFVAGPGTGGLSLTRPLTSCRPALDPTDDGTGLPVDLVISEINPGEYLEVANATTGAIDINSVAHNFCSPFNYVALADLVAGATVVPADGYVRLPWPGIFTDLDSGGEVLLYKDGLNFADGTRIIDFVCWGVNPHSSRKTLAESVGKWSGACSAALASAALHRRPQTTGTTSASYDTGTGPTPVTCGP